MNLSSLLPQPPVAIAPGAILPFAMSSAPSGWLVANGAAVSRTTYAALFAAIGTTYGAGTGGTTFNLPDLRGYFVRGSGTNSDGIAAGTFGAKQADDFQSHTHTGSAASAGAHTHAYTRTDGAGDTSQGLTNAGGFSNAEKGVNQSSQNTSSAGAHTHTLTINATGTTETRPANIAMLYCIKF